MLASRSYALAHRHPKPSSIAWNTRRSLLPSHRSLRHANAPDVERFDENNDFILSILRSNPSLRDTKSYLASFSPRPPPPPSQQQRPTLPPGLLSLPTLAAQPEPAQQLEAAPHSLLIDSILNPVYKHTALVKLQGPFSDRQLDSIARGMVYLEKLGLVSIVVVERDDWQRGSEGERVQAVDDAMRVASALETCGAKARPILDTLVRLGPKPGDSDVDPVTGKPLHPPEAHALPSDLGPIRSALRAGEIPVLPPLVLDSFCRSVRVSSNDVVAALARGLVEAAQLAKGPEAASSSSEMDLTPLRLMIINREGGIPSYARSGLPHLLVNLNSEYEFITDTFEPSWKTTHPNALGNLALAQRCLSYMPPDSSAVLVSHRSPKSLIGNLITNRPALSSSLPHALLQSTGKLTADTPTVIRRGQSIRVLRTIDQIDKPKLKTLLESSFGRKLDEQKFYERLETSLDFVIVSGDYAGAAVVTNEGPASSPDSSEDYPISYLDKFAVLPEHQGDGTVDFLWVALHDETYGLGLPYSVNPNGGKQGMGLARDLVWRSRVDNPVNKWYYERSSGHFRMGNWVLFWCDAEARVRATVDQRIAAGQGRRVSYVEQTELGRVDKWSDVIRHIPSSWS